MIGKIILNMLMLFISIIDIRNKIKVKNFFKKNLKNKSITVLDIGAHKGETIDLFYKNFNIHKIYSFEPNKNLFNFLKLHKKFHNNKIELFNIGFGDANIEKELNVFKDTSSSTIHNLNENTKYFKRKKKFISYFSRDENFLLEKQKVTIRLLSEFISEKSISKIDILKIDTEGYEYNILKNLSNNDFKKTKFIYFEHHYDLMIKKGYKFFDINQILIKNNFQKKCKLRMKFRKSFEYIYENAE